MERLGNNRQKVKKAVLLAGGLGTRFLPATLTTAKELFAIGDKPILMYHLEDLVKAGIEEVLIVGNVLKANQFASILYPPEEYIKKVESDGKIGMLEGYFDLMSKLKILYVNQDDPTFTFNGNVYQNEVLGERGSAIAIHAAKYWTNGEPFVVLNGDDLCFYKDGKSMTKEVIDVFEATGDNVVYGKELPREIMYKYSSMVLGNSIPGINGACKMLDIVEKPERGTEPSTIMGFCRYVLTSDFFDRIFKVKPRPNGEWNMTDVLQDLARSGKASMCIFGGDYFDCGSMAGFALANVYVAYNNSSTYSQVKAGLEKMMKNEPEKEK